jgi:eukaryotic-like serine/threonine-protein kinase
MCAENRCRTCGNAMPNGTLTGLCPVCLFREGLAGDGSAVATGPFMSGTQGVTSALATFDKSLGGLPHVLLRDSELNDGPGPVVQPGSPEMPAVGNRTGRLQLLGEIARGGMGAVLKGRDPDLGRDLAVKVLLESHRDKPDLIRRFFEEAQIGGQLQHPGIVPIYELGAFADHRPYFAIKLVKGRTLSSLLDERSDQVHDLPRFLSIFESVCQTIAYAHARGVIHRDLKPSNIMIGSFGEVQVMDWGLAKVLPQGGVADDVSAGKIRERETVIATARSGGDSDSDLSRAGSVMGTPSYMAPEQARGEVDRLDERCDVFALGSILCEILTGEPAFIGRSSGEIQRKASRGELKDALDRLNGSGSDVELIALAKDCLATELEDRPRHAGEIAAQIISYQTGVQERLRRAEIARAEEKARAEEATKRANAERDRQRLTVALAASVIGLIVLGVGGSVYLGQLKAAQRAETERVVAQSMDEANMLRGQAKAAAVGDLSKWPEVLAAVKNVRSLLATAGPDQALLKRVESLLALVKGEQATAVSRAAELDRDRKFLERLEAIRLEAMDREDDGGERADTAYSTAFREFGIDPDQLRPIEVGRLLQRRSNVQEAASYLDEWAIVRQWLPARKNHHSWKRLIASARAADLDPWRDALRQLVVAEDWDGLARLADDKQALAVQPTRSLVLLSGHLGDHLGRLVVDRILKPTWKIHPDDFSVCYALGFWNDVRFSTAAVALRPQSAAARYQLAQRLMPPDGIELALWHTVPVKPLAEIEEAINHYREAIRLKPDLCHFHLRLAHALFLSGSRQDEAIAEYRHAIRLDRWPFSQQNLAVDLFRVGKWEQAFAECRDVIRRYPDHEMIRFSFIDMLQARGESAEVISELRELIRLSPENSYPRELLADALFHRGEIVASIAACRDAVRLDPEQAELRKTLGSRLLDLGEIDDSLGEIREALKAEPNNPNFMDSRGWALVMRGEIKEGLTCLLEANRLVKDQPRPELRERLRLVERLTALEGGLDAILHGRNVLADEEGKLDVADLVTIREPL